MQWARAGRSSHPGAQCNMSERGNRGRKRPDDGKYSPAHFSCPMPWRCSDMELDRAVGKMGIFGKSATPIVTDGRLDVNQVSDPAGTWGNSSGQGPKLPGPPGFEF